MSRLNFMTKNFLYNKVMNNLKKLRKLHNLNQSDVAKIVGIEQSTYAKYERGEIPLNEIYAKLLADYYNVSLSYLFDDSKKRSYSNFRLLIEFLIIEKMFKFGCFLQLKI